MDADETEGRCDMSGAMGLLICLAIAAVIVAVGNLRGMGWFRRGLNRAATRNTANLGAAKIIAGAGDAKDVSSIAGRLTFPLTIGVRLLSTFLAAALVYQFWQDTQTTEPMIAPVGHAFTVLAGVALLAMLYLVHIRSCALVIQDFELHVPRYGPGHRVYDLRKIEHMEDDGSYNLNIWFSEGGKASIIKHVEGRGALIKTLNDYLAQSPDGIGGLRA